MPGLVAASLQSLPLRLCLFSSFYEDASHRIRAHPNLAPHLGLIISAKTLFPNEVTFTGQGLRTST